MKPQPNNKKTRTPAVMTTKVQRNMTTLRQPKPHPAPQYIPSKDWDRKPPPQRQCKHCNHLAKENNKDSTTQSPGEFDITMHAVQAAKRSEHAIADEPMKASTHTRIQDAEYKQWIQHKL